MSVDWAEVNARRISEKTQEIQIYCAQKRQNMTPRAFELARMSFERLLDNISDRTPKANYAIKALRENMEIQDECIAKCDKKHAAALARGIIYNYIGDDLNLYPVTAEKKLLRSKVRKQKECDIPIDEMTTLDIIYVASSIAYGENYSKQTMRAVYGWFHEIGLEPIMARLFSILFLKKKAVSIRSLPQQSLFFVEYRKAAKVMVEKGFITEISNGVYCVTETTIA